MPKFIRYFSILLCLILIFTFTYSPIQAQAYVSGFSGVGYSALFSVLFSSEFRSFVSDGVGAFSNLIASLWNLLPQHTRVALEVYENSGNESFTLESKVADEIFIALISLGAKQVYDMGIKHNKVDLSTQELQREDLIKDNTELYLPSADQIENMDLLTAQQLIVDYTKQQVSISKQIKSALQSFSYSMQGFTESFAEDYASFQAMVHGYLSSSVDWLKSINENLQARFAQVTDLISTLNLNVVRKINLLTDWFPLINNTFHERLSSVADHLVTINSNIKVYFGKTFDWLKGIQTAVTTQGQQIVEKLELIEHQLLIFPQKLDDIYDQILTLPKQEQVQVVQKPQIQVPIYGQEQILVTDYATLGSAFEMKLSWIPEIFNFLRELFNRIAYTGEPPKISLPLTAATGRFNFKSDVMILDMSLYEPYKPYGDKIISGFLWLGFGWNLYKRTPSILNGIGISQEPVASGYGYTGNFGKTNGSRKRGKNDD